jgi:hypothetical protein
MTYQIFKLPRATQIDSSLRVTPGAKAYFFETLTSTPQDTYQDSALTTEHANPVVADANGVFPEIYLDSTKVYKLTLTTSADVLIYTVDPANDQTELTQDVFNFYDLTAPTTEARKARGSFTLPAGASFFGDSFWEEPNSHTSSGHSMAYKAAAMLGVTASIDATSGNTSADKQDSIFAANPAASALWLTGLGQNDAQFIGTSSDTERRYNDVAMIHLANHFQMGVPSGSRRVTASAMSQSGTWTNDGDIAEGGALKSNTNGDALQADLSDARYVVIIFKIETGNGGKFRVLIDGNEYFSSFDSVGFHNYPFANIPTNTSKTFARCALVFDTGRRKSLTQVQMVVSSSTNASNVVSICQVMGLSGAPLTGPLAVVCDLTDRGAAGYATSSGSKAAVPIISRLIMASMAVAGTCGCRMIPVMLSSAVNAQSQLDTDEFHPNENGAVAGATAIADAVENAAIDWSVTRYDLDAQALVNGSTGYPLLLKSPLTMGPGGLPSREKLSPRMVNFRANDPILCVDSIRVCLDDGSGTFNASYSLYLAREAGDAGVAYIGNFGNGDVAFVYNAAPRMRLSAGGALVPEADGSLQLGSFSQRFSSGWFSSTVKIGRVTVSQLPSAATFVDCLLIVTDANATTPNSIVAGSGSNVMLVKSDGTNWRIV